ncbi:MAG: hypothetical protein AAF499_17830, partial [Pseudomonadota bacterium]
MSDDETRCLEVEELQDWRQCKAGLELFKCVVLFYPPLPRNAFFTPVPTMEPLAQETKAGTD